MKTFSKNLFLSLSLLMPLAACPWEEPAPEEPIFDACASDEDLGADGTIDSRWRYYYENGLDVRDEHDIGLDGTIDEEWITSYDADGNMTKIVFNQIGEDGQMILVYAQFETWDGGRRTSRETDSDGDGQLDSRRTFVYNGDGQLSETRYDGRNGGPDGTIDSVTRSFYQSAGGARTHTETDSDLDGIADSRTEFSYDDDDRLTREEVDLDLDGTPDEIRTRTYQENGFLQRSTDDSDADGVIDYEMIWTYAGDRPTTVKTIRRDLDGETADLSTLDYDCSEDGSDGKPAVSLRRVDSLRLSHLARFAPERLDRD